MFHAHNLITINGNVETNDLPFLSYLQKKMHFACRDILLKPMTFAGPNNYLQVPGFFRRPRMFVKFKFRSWDYTGLLMFTRFADDLGALELGLSEGQINVTIFQPGKKKLQFAAGRDIQPLALLDIYQVLQHTVLYPSSTCLFAKTCPVKVSIVRIHIYSLLW